MRRRGLTPMLTIFGRARISRGRLRTVAYPETPSRPSCVPTECQDLPIVISCDRVPGLRTLCVPVGAVGMAVEQAYAVSGALLLSCARPDRGSFGLEVSKWTPWTLGRIDAFIRADWARGRIPAGRWCRRIACDPAIAR